MIGTGSGIWVQVRVDEAERRKREVEAGTMAFGFKPPARRYRYFRQEQPDSGYAGTHLQQPADSESISTTMVDKAPLIPTHG